MEDLNNDVTQESSPVVESPVEVVETPVEPEVPKDTRSEAELSLIREIQEERRERQRLAQEVDFLRGSIQQTPAEPEFDPDDLVTRGDLEKMRMEEREKLTAERTAEQRQLASSSFIQSHSDFQDMMKLADDLVAQNPAMEQVILNSANPAAVAYEYAKTHPAYINKKIEEAAQARQTQTVEKIKKNVETPATLTEGGGGTTPEYKPGDIMKLSREEFHKQYG